MKTISSIEAELAKVETDLSKAQARVDVLTAKLLDLQKQKQEYEARQIMDAYRKVHWYISRVLYPFNPMIRETAH